MKESLCILCKKDSNIKINILNYCKTCFIKQFESKLQKNFRNIPYKSKILFIYNGSIENIIFLDMLANLKNNKFHEFFIFNSSTTKCEEIYKKYNFFQNVKFYKIYAEMSEVSNFLKEKNIVPDNLQNDLISFVKYHNIDVILYCRSLENVCIDLIYKVSEGLKINKNDVDDLQIKDFSFFINLYKNIKNKEIQFMAFLKNIEIISETSKFKDKKRASIKKFINEIDKNNPLASFNIINTIKKIN